MEHIEEPRSKPSWRFNMSTYDNFCIQVAQAYVNKNVQRLQELQSKVAKSTEINDNQKKVLDEIIGNRLYEIEDRWAGHDLSADEWEE